MIFNPELPEFLSFWYSNKEIDLENLIVMCSFLFTHNAANLQWVLHSFIPLFIQQVFVQNQQWMFYSLKQFKVYKRVKLAKQPHFLITGAGKEEKT